MKIFLVKLRWNWSSHLYQILLSCTYPIIIWSSTQNDFFLFIWVWACRSNPPTPSNSFFRHNYRLSLIQTCLFLEMVYFDEMGWQSWNLFAAIWLLLILSVSHNGNTFTLSGVVMNFVFRSGFFTKYVENVVEHGIVSFFVLHPEPAK